MSLKLLIFYMSSSSEQYVSNSTVSYNTYSSSLTYGGVNNYIQQNMGSGSIASNCVYQTNPTMVVPQTGTYYLPSGSAAWVVNGY